MILQMVCVFFITEDGVVGMTIVTEIMSCGHVFIYVICQALRLVDNKTTDNTGVDNRSIGDR